MIYTLYIYGLGLDKCSINCLYFALKLTFCFHTTRPAVKSSGVFVVVVEVDAKQKILQMGLVASVHQFGHH